MLEDVLVANPDMLMSGLTLVWRQIPVETGFVDLVGIDEDGRQVVFELKREKLTRAAVAQVLDYCTYLETLSDSEIGTLLAERSSKDSIERIGDFEAWADDHPARWRACPRVAFRHDRRTRGNPHHVLSGGRRPVPQGARAAQGCDSIRTREAPEHPCDATRAESGVLPTRRTVMAEGQGPSDRVCSGRGGRVAGE